MRMRGTFKLLLLTMGPSLSWFVTVSNFGWKSNKLSRYLESKNRLKGLGPRSTSHIVLGSILRARFAWDRELEPGRSS